MKGLKKLNLTEHSRKFILGTFKPIFKNVVCHHITLQYGKLSECFGEDLTSGKVVGYLATEILQTVVVELAGNTKRDDGKIYHITLALADGIAPKQSNDELERVGFEICTPIDITLELETIIHKA